ncbi:MAG: protein kinase domain-containing protein, partial [Gemmatimonadales bacterium]
MSADSGERLPTLQSHLAGRYQIERELGRGGMATVYLARDLKHHRLVALKVLRPELSAILGGERFLREIRLTAALQHPHILPLLDSGEAGGVLFYVMPYVEGESLRHRLEREGQLALEEALHITRGVSGALEYAHRLGVIHRDIKPENILLYQGEPMVADFGLAILEREPDARLTATGVSLGTPAYMAPEQVAGEVVDGRADVYGLGCLLFEMLTGSPPFTGGSAAEIMGRRFREAAPLLRTVRPDVPATIEAAVARALAVSQAVRFQSPGAFAAALGARDSGSVFRRLTRRQALAAGLAVAVTSAAAGIVHYRVPRIVESATLAVLPVRDLDPGDTSAFAAGLTEDLTAAAAAVPGLLVVSSRSASAVRGETEDLRVIGHRLGVAAVVESTIRFAGERLRMVVRLVRTSDGGVIWSERYDRQRQDVMALQD